MGMMPIVEFWTCCMMDAWKDVLNGRCFWRFSASCSKRSTLTERLFAAVTLQLGQPDQVGGGKRDGGGVQRSNVPLGFTTLESSARVSHVFI